MAHSKEVRVCLGATLPPHIHTHSKGAAHKYCSASLNLLAKAVAQAGVQPVTVAVRPQVFLELLAQLESRKKAV